MDKRSRCASTSRFALFGKSHKSTAEIVGNLRDALLALEKDDKKTEKAVEEVKRRLQAVKLIVFEQTDQEPRGEQLTHEIFDANVLPLLIRNLAKLDFESKKEVALIFNNLLGRKIGTRSPAVEYLCMRPEIVFTLFKGYESPELATVCGMMARQCIRHEDLANIIIRSEQSYDFFDYVESPSFDVASDAFQTFRDLMTNHPGICAEFLERNHDRFFERYQILLLSYNYVVRRRSLRLLGDTLLDRHNFSVMQRFTNNVDNLKLVMNALKDNSPSIQFEAFHVFK
ncbi:Cab39 protein, partial [Aphelenchoides avenae]